MRYHFGPYEVDTGRGELLKYGLRLRLERKPYQLLLALLERAGQVVPRSELHRSLWGQDTFVDFENGLNVAVKKLRATLVDSAGAPIYVETVPGEGYRFRAAVNETAVGEFPGDSLEPVPAEKIAPATQEPPAATLVQGSSPHIWMRAALAVFILVCVGGIAAFYPRPAAVPAPSTATVLIGPFENTTGEPVLDGTLQFALERELSNSQYLRVVPPERVQDILHLMRRPPQTRVDRALCLEICRRTPEIRALVTGRVEKIGLRYLLTAQIIDPSSGTALRGEETQADSQNNILSAVHGLAIQVRHDVGEAVPASDTDAADVEQVTTNSLRALQLYSEADNLMIVNGPGGQDIVDLLKQALVEDPDFATAHVMLGYVLSNIGHRREGVQHFERAMALANMVSKHERLFIVGSYYEVHGDIPRASAVYEELLRHYPDDMWALNNLADFYRAAGRQRDALRLSAHRAILRPETRDRSFADLWTELMRAGDVADANTLATNCTRHSDTGPCEALLMLVDAQPLWQQLRAGHPKEALRLGRQLAQRSAQVGPEATGILNSTLYELYMDLGMLGAADQVALKTTQPDYEYGEAMIAHARGDLIAESAFLTPVVRNPDWVGPGTFMRLIEVNRIPEACSVLAYKEKLKQAPDLVRLAHGFIKLAEGDAAGSLADFRLATNSLQKQAGGGYIPAVDHEATALEQTGDTKGAIAVLVDLQDQLAAYGDSFVAHYYNLDARWHLARLYRQGGQLDKAATVENSLRAQLQYADPDHTIARALKEIPGSAVQASALP